MNDPLRAKLWLENAPIGKAGADRIALVEAVATTGSITAAAKQIGLSYRAAWDAVQVLNNLFDKPLIVATPGGSRGGEAYVTPYGTDIAMSFRLLEEGLQRNLSGLQLKYSGSARAHGPDLIWALGMKTSARNALSGVVESVIDGAVNAEVVLRLGETTQIVAIVTSQSVFDLGLVPGSTAVALINAGSIILALANKPLQTSARNSLSGLVTEIRSGAVNDEVTLQLDTGKTLVATISSESVARLDLSVGQPVLGLIKASHVILAVG